MAQSNSETVVNIVFKAVINPEIAPKLRSVFLQKLFDLDPVICEKVCLLTPEDIANYVGNSVITDFGDALFALRRNLSDNYDKPTQGQLEYQEDMKAEGKRKQRRAEDPTILVCKDPMTLLKEVKFAASLTPGTEF